MTSLCLFPLCTLLQSNARAPRNQALGHIVVLYGCLQEAKQRQAAEEAAKTGEDANDLEKAQDFGRLRTMKVQQARVTGTLLDIASTEGLSAHGMRPANSSTAFSGVGS